MGPTGKTSRNCRGTFSFFKGLPAREYATKGVEGEGTGTELSGSAVWDMGSIMGDMTETGPLFSELGDPTLLSSDDDAC